MIQNRNVIKYKLLKNYTLQILVMEGTGGWYLDRDDGSGRYRKTENSMAVLWFSSMDKCDEFMRARENPFREGDFPTQHGYDSFFLPLLTMPVFGRSMLNDQRK